MRKAITNLGVAALTVLSSAQADAISIDIVNVTGTSQARSAAIHFDGVGNFTFIKATTGSNAGYDFIINGITDGVGDSFGLVGNISGTFTIGAITPGTPETALVTSSPGATLSIFDGTTTFSGFIDWMQLARDGTSGDLNLAGAVNLTGITYGGSVQDLLDLMGGDNRASATISFSFLPAKTLAQLKTSVANTSYSGDLASVPDGGLTVSLLGMALASLGVASRRLRK